jgi:tetratricopeptide (TPR) repeat protein
MIMKNKNPVGCCLLVIGYWLLVDCLPVSIFHLTSSQAAESGGNFKSKFLQITLNIPDDEKDKTAKNELKRMIKQIRSINVELRKDAPEPAVVPDEVTIDEESNEVVFEDKDTKEQQKKDIEPGPANGIIAKQTVRILRKLSKNPGNLNNPLELAETLFLCNYLREAAICYKEALKRKRPDDPHNARDRAWILFQIGNCLRYDDPNEAIKMYGRLITEYPNSTWKKFAETRRTLLDWYVKEEPRNLINERKQ